MSGLLLVLAHPDDEAFLGGGALTFYARRGVHTAYLCLTLGQSGRMGISGQEPLASRETLGEVRREELRRAASRLEIAELIAPGWRDGALDGVADEKGIGLVTSHIRRIQPEVLLSFGPEGAPSGHADHLASHRWSAAAFERAAEAAYNNGRPPHRVKKYYWITWPRESDHLRDRSGSEITTILELGDEIARLKRDAFAEHATQHDHMELYTSLQDGLDGKEFFHLAKSRVGFSTAMETDLLARIAD